MKILIDLQGAQTESRFRGIGRYSRSLALGMARNAGNHEIWLILNAAFPESIDEIRALFKDAVPEERIRIFDIPSPVAEMDPANDWRARAGERLREHFISLLQPDALLLTSLFEGYLDNAATSVKTVGKEIPTAVVLYDLIPLLHPETYLAAPGQKEYYDRKVDSLKRADLLLAISEHSRSEAVSALGLPPRQVVTISTAADGFFGEQADPDEDIESIKKKFGLTRDFVMYTPGGFDARKNIEGLISAYGLLPESTRKRHQLLISSKISAEVRAHLEHVAANAGLVNGELVLAGYVSEQQLRALYRTAKLFIFPSKHEGFGLPVLEAMSCGAPVIGANNTSIPEVIGNEEALFDASNAESISAKMQQVLQDEELLLKLAELSRIQAAKFSWDKTAIRAVEALETLVHSRKAATIAPLRCVVSESELIESIADIRSAVKPCLNDLAVTADCIAFNSGSNAKPELFVEITGADGACENEAVPAGTAGSLVPRQERRFICFDGSRHREVKRFTDPLSGELSLVPQDDIVGFHQFDQCIVQVFQLPTQQRLDCYRRMKQRGVRLRFLLHRLPDEAFNESGGPLLADLIRTGDETLCPDPAFAERIIRWLELEHPELRNRLQDAGTIETFNP